MNNTCVACGAVVPEGRQVCPECERKTRQSRCSPCKDCTDRHEACHDTCDPYRDWKADHNAAMKYLHEKNMPLICKYAMKVRDRKLKRGR